jgi:tRNA(Ile)-lysidine synthase
VVSHEGFAFACGELGLSRNDCVIIANSGGVDSLALCWLAHKYFDKALSVTIEHGLRDDSLSDAEAARRIAKVEIGMPAFVRAIRWPDNSRPLNQVQELCRTERYNRLGSAMHELGASAVLTAHHLDDQIETTIMRMENCSGILGLPGILKSYTRADVKDCPSFQIARPLLSFGKKQLIATCLAQGLTVVEDPTNVKMIYRRNDVRRQLNAASPEARIGMVALVNVLGAAKRALDDSLKDDPMSRVAIFNAKTGHAEVDLIKLQTLSPPVRVYVFLNVMHRVKGDGGQAPIAQLRTALDALFKQCKPGATHSRYIFMEK